MQTENKITDEDGNEYVQRKISIKDPVKIPLKKGKRIRVYNKLRTRVHCSDCVLEPESEGSILVSDFNHPKMQDYLIKTA